MCKWVNGNEGIFEWNRSRFDRIYDNLVNKHNNPKKKKKLIFYLSHNKDVYIYPKYNLWNQGVNTKEVITYKL